MTRASSTNTIRTFLAAQRDEAHAFLAELVRIPSDNPPGDCAPHAEHTAALLQNMGFEVERHAVPEALCRQHEMKTVTNLVVRRRYGPGPVVALNAHGDVVPPGRGWTHDPYGGETENGTMYGRGVAVSKSDFATYAFALRALETCAANLNGGIELHFTYDEETGGDIGPGWLLREGIVAPDYCINAGFSHSVVVAHSGCLHLEAELTGTSAHAAMPASGCDALEAATSVLRALYDERDRLYRIDCDVPGIETPTLTVGLIDGGINTNVVPDRVILRLDRRMIPGEDPDRVEDEVRRLIEHSANTHPGITVTSRRVMLAVPLKSLDGTPHLADVLQRHAQRVFDETIPTLGVPLYTDARHYSEAGIPTVIYGAGPHTLLEANGHRADEKLRLSDLDGATEVVACTLLELLSD